MAKNMGKITNNLFNNFLFFLLKKNRNKLDKSKVIFREEVYYQDTVRK